MKSRNRVAVNCICASDEDGAKPADKVFNVNRFAGGGLPQIKQGSDIRKAQRLL
jgi:hypothetical protein